MPRRLVSFRGRGGRKIEFFVSGAARKKKSAGVKRQTLRGGDVDPLSAAAGAAGAAGLAYLAHKYTNWQKKRQLMKDIDERY